MKNKINKKVVIVASFVALSTIFVSSLSNQSTFLANAVVVDSSSSSNTNSSSSNTINSISSFSNSFSTQNTSNSSIVGISSTNTSQNSITLNSLNSNTAFSSTSMQSNPFSSIGNITSVNSSTNSSELYFEELPTATEENSGPNNGDGNGDGIADSNQSNVATILTLGQEGNYTTLQLSNTSNNSPTCTTLKGATNYQPYSIPNDDGYAYPVGVINFGVQCLGSVNVKLFWHGVSDIAQEGLEVRKYIGTQNSQGNWVTPNYTNSTEIINGVQTATTSYTLADGSSDDNSSTQGLIVDPIGLAFELPPLPGNTGSSSSNTAFSSSIPFTYQSSSANYTISSSFGNQSSQNFSSSNTQFSSINSNFDNGYTFCTKTINGYKYAIQYLYDEVMINDSYLGRNTFFATQNNTSNVIDGKCVNNIIENFVPKIPNHYTTFNLDSNGHPENVVVVNTNSFVESATCEGENTAIVFSDLNNDITVVDSYSGFPDFDVTTSVVPNTPFKSKILLSRKNSSFGGTNSGRINVQEGYITYDFDYGYRLPNNSLVVSGQGYVDSPITLSFLNLTVKAICNPADFAPIVPSSSSNSSTNSQNVSSYGYSYSSATYCSGCVWIPGCLQASYNLSNSSSAIASSVSNSSLAPINVGCTPQFQSSSSQNTQNSSLTITVTAGGGNISSSSQNNQSSSNNPGNGTGGIINSSSAINISSQSSARSSSSNIQTSSSQNVVAQSSTAQNSSSLQASSQINSTTNTTQTFAGSPTLPSVAIENSAPNNGDGNGDGVKDALQDNVVSIPSASGNGYTTAVFTGNGECAKGFSMKNVTQSSFVIDQNRSYPFGLVDFAVKCSGTTNVKMYWHGIADLANENYEIRKITNQTPGQNSTKSWYKPSVTNASEVINGVRVATTSYSLVDGQLGDDTGTDGYIVDPVGPAKILVNATSGTASNPINNITFPSSQSNSNPAQITTSTTQNPNSVELPKTGGNSETIEPQSQLEGSGKGILTRTGGLVENTIKKTIGMIVILLSLAFVGTRKLLFKK
jgi:hypothetical protein